MRRQRGVEDRSEPVVVNAGEIRQAERAFPTGKRMTVEVDELGPREISARRVKRDGADVGTPAARRNAPGPTIG
jgi:hypothetical protein